MGKDIIKQIKEIVEIYSKATGISCRVMNIKGREFSSYGTEVEEYNFCQLVKGCQNGHHDCLQSDIYGGLQAEKLGEPYIYFCPYGLVNWAVPILGDRGMEFFIIGGPVLMHEVDQLLLDEISKQNSKLQENIEEIKEKLNMIKVVDTVRVRYLAELLMKLAKTVMPDRVRELEKRQDINLISSRIAEEIHNLKENELENGEIGVFYPLEKEKELITRVKLGDQQGSQEILNEILGFVYFQSGNKLQIVKSKAIELMVVLARAAIEVGADLEIIFGLEYTYFEKINQVEDINDLSIWLTRVLDRFIECSFSIKNIKNKDIIFKAMNYIRNNYNREISLGDVAADVGLSPAYFSKVFKDELDMTYTDYLNKVRIQFSKNLLNEGLPLAEIAQKTGFSDQSYYSRVFKRLEGISPGKWADNK